MAMFENEGFCPSNSFGFYIREREDKNALSDRVLDILGDRRGYMVYDKDSCSKEAYVVDMFLGGNTTLGLEVAVILREYDPKCVYAEHGKKILIYDLINPHQMPLEVSKYEDDRYLVGLLDGNDIQMYIYRK